MYANGYIVTGKEREREREREFHAREILITRSKWLEMFQTKLP